MLGYGIGLPDHPVNTEFPMSRIPSFPESTSRSLFLRHLHLPRLWVPFFIMIGVSILSGTAGPQTGPITFVGIDKVGHFVVFGLLGIAWTRVFLPGGLSGLPCLLIATGLTTLFGLLDELHQFHNPMRTFEWADLAADFAGALVCSAAYLWLPFLQALAEVKIRYRPRLHSTVKASEFSHDG